MFHHHVCHCRKLLHLSHARIGVSTVACSSCSASDHTLVQREGATLMFYNTWCGMPCKAPCKSAHAMTQSLLLHWQRSPFQHHKACGEGAKCRRKSGAGRPACLCKEASAQGSSLRVESGHLINTLQTKSRMYEEHSYFPSTRHAAAAAVLMQCRQDPRPSTARHLPM